MEPAANTAELKSLDVLLSNKDMASKLKRYIQTKKKLSGKGDGSDGPLAKFNFYRSNQHLNMLFHLYMTLHVPVT